MSSLTVPAVRSPAAPPLDGFVHPDFVAVAEALGRQLRSYPGGAAVLLEFYDNGFPPRVDQLLGQLRERGLTPVIAHPERYRVIWDRPTVLDRLLDSGAVALLDVAALVGKYGRQPQRCAERLLEGGAYHAACSDAHRVRDVAEVARGIDLVRRRYGDAEVASRSDGSTTTHPDGCGWASAIGACDHASPKRSSSRSRSTGDTAPSG